MTRDELRKLEGARRRALWALASLRADDQAHPSPWQFLMRSTPKSEVAKS